MNCEWLPEAVLNTGCYLSQECADCVFNIIKFTCDLRPLYRNCSSWNIALEVLQLSAKPTSLAEHLLDSQRLNDDMQLNMSSVVRYGRGPEETMSNIVFAYVHTNSTLRNINFTDLLCIRVSLPQMLIIIIIILSYCIYIYPQPSVLNLIQRYPIWFQGCIRLWSLVSPTSRYLKLSCP